MPPTWMPNRHATVDTAAPETAVARPYGSIGLVLSLVVILIVATLACMLLSATAFGLASLILGWRQALERFVALRDAAGSEAAFLQRAGVVVSLMVYAMVGATVLAVARFRAGPRWRDLVAWHDWHPVRGARVFWILVAATLIYSFAADALISHLYPPSNDWVTMPSGGLWAGLFVILAVVFAPFAEELVFRGWIYTSLRDAIGMRSGIVVSSTLFALAHWEKTHLYALAVFPVGLVLGYVRERADSLKASIAFHAIYNASASAILVFAR